MGFPLKRKVRNPYFSRFPGEIQRARPGQPCYFVDVTDLAVDLRFDQHMHGIKDNASRDSSPQTSGCS
jgi:hypothetical protein